MPELDLIKLSALTNSIDAADSAKDSALAAATEALSASDIDPNYISYTVGTKPATSGAVEGTIGAYYTSSGLLQKLELVSGAWVDVGEAISAKKYVDDKASLLSVPTNAESLIGDGETNNYLDFEEIENSSVLNHPFIPEGDFVLGNLKLSKKYKGSGSIRQKFNEQSLYTYFDLDQRNKKTEVVRLTSVPLYANWPQGKCFVCDGEIYVFYNQGPEHVSPDLSVWFQKSGDGIHWTAPKLAFKENGWTKGVTAWSVGCDSSDNLWMILRKRGDNFELYDEATNPSGTKHSILKSSDFGDSWTVEVESIGFTENGSVAVEYMDMAQLGNGNLAVGYHFPPISNNRRTGILQFDPSNPTSYTVNDILTGAENPNGYHLEPSIYYDSSSGTAFGFLRVQDQTEKNIFWKSTDNCSTFTTQICNFTNPGSPITVDVHDGVLYAASSRREGNAGVYLFTANLSNLLTNGPSEIRSEIIAMLRHPNDLFSSGTGVGHLVCFNDRVHFFMGYDEWGIFNSTSKISNIFGISITLEDEIYSFDKKSSDFSNSFSLPNTTTFDPVPEAITNINSLGGVTNEKFTQFGAMVMFQFRIANVACNSQGLTRIRFKVPIPARNNSTFLGGTAYRVDTNRDAGTVINGGGSSNDKGMIVINVSSPTSADLEVSGYYMI